MMSYVAVQGYPHTWTCIPDGVDPWQAFAGASEGGGTPPEWTQSDDPRTSVPPADAAGTLWREGDTDEVPPTIREAAERLAEEFDTQGEFRPLAAYFSSGGRGVFLAQFGDGPYYIQVWRNETTPRIGASEAAMCARVDLSACDHVVLFHPGRTSRWNNEEEAAEQWFKWTVEIEVNGTWVSDGFEITAERLNRMLAEELGFSYDSERRVRVVKSPDPQRIRAAQGY